MKENAEMKEAAVNLAADAQVLLAATAHAAEAKVVEARKRLAAALERGKENWGRVRDYTLEKAKETDEVIREHPYQSIGIAFGVGVLLGVLIARRG